MARAEVHRLMERMAIPAIAAPMFLVSNPARRGDPPRGVRGQRLEQLDVTHPQRTRAGTGRPDGQHGLADPLLLVLLQGQHPDAERLPVHVDGTAQVAAGDADVIEAGQQR